MAFSRIRLASSRAFWRAPLEDYETPRLAPLTPGVILPTVMLVVFGLSLTVFGGPLYEIADRAAISLLERTPYMATVLGPGGR